MFDDRKDPHCPTCGKTFAQLGSHFAEKPKHRPHLDDDTMDALAGILMGDGTMVDKANHPQLRVELTEPQYLTWLQREYPFLFGSITRMQRDQPHADVYKIRTIPHPQLHEFSSWYRSGKKQFPANLTLSPKMVKHWYCCDGGLNWPGNSDSGASACLYSVNEDGGSIVELFNEVGFDPTSHSDHRIYFSRDETPTLLGWMGVPPDGFEYKWEWQDKARYKQKKETTPVTDDSLSNLSNDLIELAGQLQQVTTQVNGQERAGDMIDNEREKHKEEISQLKERHEEELEKEVNRAKKCAKREMRDELLRNIYSRLGKLDESDKNAIKRGGGISQRMLGEAAGLSQQQVGNIVNQQKQPD